MITSERLRYMDASERERTEPVRLMRLSPTRRFISATELDNLNMADSQGPECWRTGAAVRFLLLAISLD